MKNFTKLKYHYLSLRSDLFRKQWTSSRFGLLQTVCEWVSLLVQHSSHRNILAYAKPQQRGEASHCCFNHVCSKGSLCAWVIKKTFSKSRHWKFKRRQTGICKLVGCQKNFKNCIRQAGHLFQSKHRYSLFKLPVEARNESKQYYLILKIKLLLWNKHRKRFSVKNYYWQCCWLFLQNNENILVFKNLVLRHASFVFTCERVVHMRVRSPYSLFSRGRSH